jgi:hypothetical protein
MIKNILLGFASIALAVASAASTYNITFYQPVMLNGTELKAGDYTLELKDNSALIKQGDSAIEAPVTIRTVGKSYDRNIVRLEHRRVEEIGIAGTNTRILFDKTPGATTKASNAAIKSNSTN